MTLSRVTSTRDIFFKKLSQETNCIKPNNFEPSGIKPSDHLPKERDRKSELVLRSTYQIFEWDRNNTDRKFYNVVRYVHIPLVP